MTESSSGDSFPAEKRERLVSILYPKRASFIFFYVFGTMVFIIGTGFMIVTSYFGLGGDLVSWSLSAGAMVFGILLVVWAESRRWFTLYIITTWNVRVRRGVLSRKTVRVFYDEIALLHCSGPPAERKIGMGDVEIFISEDDDAPALVFDGVHNPDGVREILRRFVETIPDPVPWAHLDRT
ncbi:MAG: PH domain-containing protein [Candidatus Thorarchaeota archaeon]|nr:PH domain-containing protein [Candidatus Thorarchaeota archaeon]